MSSFRSRSPPLCFERVGSSQSKTSDETELTHCSDSNPHLDTCCCSSSTSINLDYDPFLKNVTKLVSNREIKETITSSSKSVGENSGLMSTLSSVVKRLSTAELEHMIQNKLGKVIDGHHYTSWLRKEVNESDAQLAKYKNRIEVLQKHVNDLSTVIQNHMQSSGGSYSPPRKLTRNVGLQVRIKETKGSELCSTSSCQTPVDATLMIDHSVNLPSTQDNLDKQKQNDVDEHQCSPIIENTSSIEIDLTHSDSDESPNNRHQSPRTSPVPVVLVSSDMPIVSHCKSNDGEKSGDGRERSGLPGLGTSSPSCIHPAMDSVTASNCRISSTNTTFRPSSKPPCMETMSSSTSDGTCPIANSSPDKSVGFICTTRSAAAAASLVECHPSAGPSSGQQSNNADKGSYSNGDRKRRLPCSITSIDASTIASVEKYHKSIKERWYESNEPPAEISSARPRCTTLSQSEVHHPNHSSMIVAQQSFTQHQPVHVNNPCPMNTTRSMPIIPKPIQHREFAKQVESIGLYHKWKLPIPPYINSLPPTQSPGRQSSVILESSSKQLQNQQQSQPKMSNIRTWIPRSNCLDSLFSPTNQISAPDANGFSVHLPDQPLNPSIHHHQQSELQPRCNKTNTNGTHPSTQLHQQSSHGPMVKKIIPDLIAITKEDASISRDPSLLPAASPTVNEWKMNLITTHFKPILMLTRSEGGIRVEWTIPNLNRSQQVGQIESYIMYARKENGLVPSSLETSWLRVAVFAALPLPMSYVFKELTPGYRYYFRIGTNFRGRSASDARAHEIPFSEPASMMM